MSLTAFRIYSLLSILGTGYLVHSAVTQHTNFYDRVEALTSFKLNLVLMLNCVVAVLSNAGSLFVYVFFTQIRTLEAKYLVEKCQKKVFQFLLMSIVLRNSLDIYKLMTIVCILFVWMLHWLAGKRLKGLVGEESHSILNHGRLLVLLALLVVFDGAVTYVFALQFLRYGNKMNDVYLIAGFEFARLLCKAIEHNFKYQVSLCELYYKEQWLEKKFAFNLVNFVFDLADLSLNVRVFLFVVSRGALPIYLLGEVVDNLTRLGASLVSMYKWRQFIFKLKQLQDVTAQDGQELQCCICLGNITQGKQLSCSHVFHLVCLRAWLIEKVECPTCRAPIKLDNARPPINVRRPAAPPDRIPRGPRTPPDQIRQPMTEDKPLVKNKVEGIFDQQTEHIERKGKKEQKIDLGQRGNNRFEDTQLIADDDNWIDVEDQIDEELEDFYEELDQQVQNKRDQCRVQAGSVAYGLPTLATTRRTPSVLQSLRQTEEVNKLLCQIMRQPHEYVQIDPSALVQK